jgi:hypothetical protein
MVTADVEMRWNFDGLYGGVAPFVATGNGGVRYSVTATVFRPSTCTVTLMCLSGPATEA